MNDFEMYARGMLNPDEMEQWDHVTEMMAERGEYDGKARDDLLGPAPDMLDEDFDEGYGKTIPMSQLISDDIPW